LKKRRALYKIDSLWNNSPFLEYVAGRSATVLTVWSRKLKNKSVRLGNQRGPGLSSSYSACSRWEDKTIATQS
jgi:hypothetical protein